MGVCCVIHAVVRGIAGWQTVSIVNLLRSANGRESVNSSAAKIKAPGLPQPSLKRVNVKTCQTAPSLSNVSEMYFKINKTVEYWTWRPKHPSAPLC